MNKQDFAELLTRLMEKSGHTAKTLHWETGIALSTITDHMKRGYSNAGQTQHDLLAGLGYEFKRPALIRDGAKRRADGKGQDRPLSAAAIHRDEGRGER